MFPFPNLHSAAGNDSTPHGDTTWSLRAGLLQTEGCEQIYYCMFGFISTRYCNASLMIIVIVMVVVTIMMLHII